MIPFLVMFLVGAVYGRVFKDTEKFFERVAPSVTMLMGVTDGLRAGFIMMLTYGLVKTETFFIIMPIMGLINMYLFTPILDKSTTEKELKAQCVRQIRQVGIYLLLLTIVMTVTN